ncbi:MAG: ABC transporter ATP-binding protein [Firmicutes bacterium]|nr:ABC transporter ATP-binding protein [Bacillota bacterium]
MIKLVNVSKYYNSNNVIALGLRKVNLELHVNEFVAVVGESGSGKTTLLNVISGIDSYEDGEMYLNGEETSYFSVSDMENYRKKYIAFVFQSYNLIDSYTVLQNVEAPLILSGYPKNQVKSRALEIIRRVGLEKHIHHKATKLSGGQKQRVVIARALAKDCPIIAADEPTGNLDSVSARQILELLHEISKDKLVIIVTHDFDQIKEFATRKIRIFDGEVVEDIELNKVEKLNLPVIPDEERQIKFLDFVKMAFRNLLSVPKKSFLMIIVFTFFAFFVALAYGSFNVNLDDISYSYNSYFENTSVSRIIVRKTDKTPFTAADLEELQALNKTQTVVPFDYLLDTYTYLRTDFDENDPENNLSFSGLYLPISVLSNEELLVAGRLPLADDEMVIAISGERLDLAADYIDRIIVQNNNYYYGEVIERVAYKIVGVINAADIYMDISNPYNGAYFLLQEDVLSNLVYVNYFRYTTDSTLIGVDQEDEAFSYSVFLNEFSFTVDNTLPDNFVIMPSWSEIGNTCISDTYCEVTGDFVITDFYTTFTAEDFTIRYSNYASDEYQDAFQASETTLNNMIYDDIYQVSVIANTDLNVKTLVNEISRIDNILLTSKYKVFYPYDSAASDSFSAIILLIQSIGMIALITLTLLGATLITYVIFKAIINTKLHDYAIFRTIGANKKMIKLFIYTENGFVTLFSFLLFVGFTLILKVRAGVETIFYSLKMYTFTNYIVFFCLMVIMALIISSKYTKRIFRESVNKTLKVE